MGVPKRKASGVQDGAASAAGAAKRARTEELTGVRFKTLLRDPQGPGPGECGAWARAESTCGRGGFWLLSAYSQTQPLFSGFRVTESQSQASGFARN